MPALTSRRGGLCLALLFALSPLLTALPPQDKTQTFDGNVVPLAELVEKIGSKLDPDAAPHWLALVTKDGKVYPVIKDDGARMFFKDERLLRRPMRLTGRLFRDTHLLQVLEVRSLLKGEPHEVYYWCDICTIKRFEKKICDCCGAPMELREVPVAK
jgi:hypothetical protein